MHLIGTSSVKGFFAQTTGHVNFNLYTIFWSFLTQFSHKLRISSACIRNIIVFHSLNLSSYLYLENDNTIIVNVYIPFKYFIYFFLLCFSRSHCACFLAVGVEVYA